MILINNLFFIEGRYVIPVEINENRMNSRISFNETILKFEK